MPEQSRRVAITLAVRDAFEVFRGICNVEDAAELVLAMGVFKFISDPGEEPARDKPSPGDVQPYVLPGQGSFRALLEAGRSADLGHRINAALAAAEQHNAELEALFHGVDFNVPRLGGEASKAQALRKLMRVFNTPAFDFGSDRQGTPEAAAFMCDAILAHAAEADGKRSGQSFTPSSLAELIARLMQPRVGESVYDPCSGMGSTLIACSRQARLHGAGGGGCSLYGQEVNGRALGLARMSLFLHGEPDWRLEWGDTLRQPKWLNGHGQLQTFDVVVCDPPFSLRDWGYDKADTDPYQRYERGIPPRASADFAFISHMLASLRSEGGRMAVLVSLGVLFRSGAERHIRQQLIQENLVDAIIALPAKLLTHGSHATAILVLRKNRTADDVLFIDASQCYQHGRARNVLRAEDIDLIDSTYHDRSTVAGFSHRASPTEIAANDYNLLAARYLHVADQTETVDLASLRAERAQLAADLARLEHKLGALMEGIRQG